jgi:hypothetical protein
MARILQLRARTIMRAPRRRRSVPRDALCDPPVSFSYGGVVAHVTTHAAHRRHVLAAALRELGVADAEPGDPMHFAAG